MSPYEYGSFGELMEVFIQMDYFFIRSVLICLSVSPADNGSTLSSEAVTDSLASTDGNYGYMGTNTHTHTHRIFMFICIFILAFQCPLSLAKCDVLSEFWFIFTT